MVSNSTITILTKQTNISHLKPLNTKPRYMSFYVRVQRSSMIKSKMGSQTPSDREWLLIGANSAIFRSWMFIVLAHGNNSLWIDISPHPVTLSWFRANQSLIFLLSDVCLSEESTNINFIFFGLIRQGLEPRVCLTRGEHVNHYTTDPVHILMTSSPSI